ncbi:large conductance mechanosensitive channel protein MscL [Kordia algicida OT-1]|uniref:Large-conductance mechanosensitive channel n=1 Tax=Kordia algicida OT-1 TaxID=391587 RepID=A9DMH9_9FLAO|nr:large conductance mechanosensitive channel protein MscL [Kordia algicida]EDP97710.1 large conductance mechanosensitive channel protein [Kordia algicida OT-1]
MKLRLFKEFKEFAVKGNMIDIAIGVIIGTAFNKVIDVLVKEVFLPPLSLLTDGINWSNKKLILREAVDNGTTKIDEVAIAYGKLFEVFVDFLIIGFTVFLVVKFMNSIKTKAQDPKNKTVVTPKDIELLSRMTELLEKQVAIAEKNATNNSKQ